ncbi:MAG: hypothetical protein MI923_19780 [Phycisphaerales bacterium]|nr:hypothetical protein [Phycisphaerales bacterium]
MMKLHQSIVACVLVALSSLFVVGDVRAEVNVLNAFENSEVVTDFSLNFPGLGISSTSNVFYTRFNLEIDDETGAARFTDYNQQIESLTLPLGITTGRIQVRILESNGTYDPQSQTFVTNDVYEITFANDLSTFGFSSPEILPATSRGTVRGGANNAQNVELQWEGSGQFENESNPAEPFEFTYTCNVNTNIAESEADVPPLPTPNSCGNFFSILSFATMSLMFVGMKRSLRRRRR